MDAAVSTTLAGPWGPISLAATQRGVVALELATPPDAFVRTLERRLHGPVGRLGEGGSTRARELLQRAADAVEAYLAGLAAELAELPLDLRGRPAWDVAVLEAVRRVPLGQVTSYGRLARAIGRPGAARAVGGALGRNPIGLAIPCHRVIAGDGSLGGYGGDRWGSREELLALKRALLEHEGVTVPARHSAAYAAGSAMVLRC
jgi:O-6-methylguanine DNA methyltransferase